MYIPASVLKKRQILDMSKPDREKYLYNRDASGTELLINCEGRHLCF